MQIEDFKRWHWALLGILAGLIFAYAWQDHDVAGDKAYDMAEIKRFCRMCASSRRSRITRTAIGKS
jgi:hypothetical protein